MLTASGGEENMLDREALQGMLDRAERIVRNDKERRRRLGIDEPPERAARDLSACLVCLGPATVVCREHWQKWECVDGEHREMPLPMCDYHAERHQELAHKGDGL